MAHIYRAAAGPLYGNTASQHLCTMGPWPISRAAAGAVYGNTASLMPCIMGPWPKSIEQLLALYMEILPPSIFALWAHGPMAHI